MSAVSLLLILIGIFILINSGNFVAVAKNEAKIGFNGTSTAGSGVGAGATGSTGSNNAEASATI